ncbi:MAG: protein-L-isoaspartate(D-aspartate) O-methyltransferase [Bacteroidetes bacterium]|nr:protein-L-isoaspartate(D-aspartate) O-methyltransferase [Bacteroidota bacterium]
MILPVQQDEYTQKRKDMVREQIEKRGIKNEAVLTAMESVPRHEFVPEGQVSRAYRDGPLPIGHGQTISQPYVVGYMTAYLEPKPTDKVLEIGTGSGYQAAVLAEITDEVFTIEIVEALSESAKEILKKQGYTNVHVYHGDGFHGIPEHAPYDKIIVTAAPGEIPQPLIDQLKEGGKMIIPVGETSFSQQLKLVTKKDGQISIEELLPVRFVPFTRD